MKHKIFLGLDDVSSSITDMAEELKSMGHETLTAVFQHHSKLDQCRVDYKFSDYKFREFSFVKPTRLKLWMQDRVNMPGKIFRKAVEECDVFIFIWESFKWDLSDYAYLKSKGKKIVSIFCGNDVRWHYASNQEYEKYGLRSIDFGDGYSKGIAHLEQKLKKLRIAEKYSDAVVSRVDQAQLALRPYYRWHMLVRPENMMFNPVQRQQNPVVAHAPSHRGLKGTKYVLEAFERLKSEGVEFTPLLIEGLPNQELLKKLSDVDILIDQLLFPGTGKIASEALSAGCVVMSLMGYKNYPQNNAPECPIVDVNPDTIYKELKRVILDYEFRKNTAAKGLDYVKRHLDYKLFCEKMMAIVDGNPPAPDYIPDFFRNKFVPEPEAVELYNRWTKEVDSTEWYRKFVPPGSRDGLIF